MGPHCTNHSSRSPLNKSSSIFQGKQNQTLQPPCTACFPAVIPLWLSSPPVKSHPALKDQLKRHRPKPLVVSSQIVRVCLSHSCLLCNGQDFVPFLQHTEPCCSLCPNAVPVLVPPHHSGLSFNSTSSERPHPVPVTSSHPHQTLSMYFFFSLANIAQNSSFWGLACLSSAPETKPQLHVGDSVSFPTADLALARTLARLGRCPFTFSVSE